MHVKLLQFALATAFIVGATAPVAAQTTLSTPNKPTPSMPATPPVAAQSAPMAKPAAATPIDINTASAADLTRLSGIGKARADAIIRNRPYKGKDDLVARHILSPSVYNGIKDKIVARQG
jgi:competence protein ComEA